MGNSNIEIDESKHVDAPTVVQKLKNAALGVVLGAVLVQMFFFYGSARSGNFTPASVVIYFENVYFLGYLAICGGLGWIGGQDFINWMKVKIDTWKFW